MTQSAIAGFVGIDWADQEHRVCLSAADSDQPEESSLRHNPEAILEFVTQLRIPTSPKLWTGAALTWPPT